VELKGVIQRQKTEKESKKSNEIKYETCYKGFCKVLVVYGVGVSEPGSAFFRATRREEQ
jgi:hypothetical protein